MTQEQIDQLNSPDRRWGMRRLSSVPQRVCHIVQHMAAREDAIKAAEDDWEGFDNLRHHARIPWEWDSARNDGTIRGFVRMAQGFGVYYTVYPIVRQPTYTDNELYSAGKTVNHNMWLNGDGWAFCPGCSIHTYHVALSTPGEPDCWEVCRLCGGYYGPGRLDK